MTAACSVACRCCCCCKGIHAAFPPQQQQQQGCYSSTQERSRLHHSTFYYLSMKMKMYMCMLFVTNICMSTISLAFCHTQESAVWFPFSRCWRSNVIRLPDESRESGSTITKKQQEKRDSTAFIATRFDDVSLEKFL